MPGLRQPGRLGGVSYRRSVNLNVRREIPFSVDTLFANGETGAWYDPSDLTTLYTDTAGTTQASVGDPVALMLDKSGNDWHVTQTTPSKRPTLRESGGLYYLEFDGIDDNMNTNTVEFNSMHAQIFAGIQKQNTNTRDQVLDIQGGSRNFIQFYAPFDARRYYFLFNGSSIDGGRVSISSGFNSPHTGVVTGLAQRDIPGDVAVLRIDGQTRDTSTASQGSGIYDSSPIYLGSRITNDRFFKGRLYALILRTAEQPEQEVIEQTESWMSSKLGVTL